MIDKIRLFLLAFVFSILGWKIQKARPYKSKMLFVFLERK